MLGKFITIEGTDGSGKTTIIKHIEEYLKNLGLNVIVTREPGGVELSEKIRDLLLNCSMDSKTEVLLFAASRREHILGKIIPELKKGTIILCDRFLDSSVAYQAYGRNLNVDNVLKINEYVLEGLEPDLTLYFNVDVELGISRTASREKNNKLDNEKKEFYKSVKKGYDNMLILHPNRIREIDANKTIEEVKQDTIKIVEELLKVWNLI